MEHKINLQWQHTTPDFDYQTYDRTYTITFDGGMQLKGSAAPAYLGKAELANPEELLIAATSSCYMLTFLAVAAKQKLVIDSYQDNAVGILTKNPEGKTSITEVILDPKIVFNGKQPDTGTLRNIHEKAHAYCFITQSLKGTVRLKSPPA